MIIKKVFIISTILLLVIVVFFGIYVIAFKPEATQKVVENIGSSVDIADVVSEKITNITSDSVVSAALGPNNDTIQYVDAISGRVWTMTLRGSNKEARAIEAKGVPLSVKWSQKGDSAIMQYADKSTYVNNFVTNGQNRLRDGMDDVVWANMDGKILYKYYDEKNKERSLNIANADGTNWKKIAELPFRETMFAQVPLSIFVAYWPKAQSSVSTELFTANTISEGESKKIFSGVFGADFLFAPDGKTVLISSVKSDKKSISLAVMDSNGQNYNDLLVPTFVQKVVWSKDGKSIYYAQPTEIPTSSVLPEDYQNGNFTTKDTFYKMDITTGKKQRIIDLPEIKDKMDAYNLFLSPMEDTLYFINKEDHLLYRITM